MPQLFGFPKVDVRGPWALPGIGIPSRLYRFLDDPVGSVMALRGRGDVVALIDRNPAIVCVFGHERTREVLSNPSLYRHDEHLFDGPPGSAFDKLSHCLVVMNGERHRRQRALLQPAFSGAAMEGYAVDIVEQTRRVLAGWPRQGVVDAAALCDDLMLGVAMKCFYGLDGDEAKRGVGRIVGEFMRVVTAPSTIMFPLDLPGSAQRRKLQLAEALVGELRTLLTRKRALGGDQRDAMALLMAARDDAGSGLGDDELMGEALELVVAGHDTSANTLTWTLFLLDQHPQILQDVQAELDAILAGRAPTLSDLPRMTLLDRVVKESMRVLSPAPMLFLRACAEDTVLGGYRLPKNANVLVSPIAVHHDARIYAHPERFRPSRWAEGSPPAYGYLPFGAGSRACVGMLFAAQSIRLVLAMILQHVQLRCEPRALVARLTRGNIMHARYGLTMRVQPPDALPTPPAAVVGDVHELVELASADPTR